MIYIVLLFMNLFNGYNQQTETVELKVIVTNINTLKGSLEMGLFDNPKTFIKKDIEHKAYSKKVTRTTEVITLKNLKKGYYAISIYHDINSDDKCNLSFLGIPQEPYGFSQNYKPMLFKPTFDDCKINVCKNMSITIVLIDKQHNN